MTTVKGEGGVEGENIVALRALVSRAKKGVHMAIWVFLAFLCIPR